MIAARRVCHLEIERHPPQECCLAPLLEVAPDVERQPIHPGGEWAPQQIADPAVRIGLARALRFGALTSFKAPQRDGDAGGGFATGRIEDVR